MLRFLSRQRRMTGAALFLGFAGLVLSACGSTSGTSSGGAANSSGVAADGVDVATAQSAVDAARALPKYMPLSTGGPINKSADLKNKVVYIIKYADFPYNQAEAQAEVDAFKLAGVKTKVVAGDGTPESWGAGIGAAVAAHADAVNLMGMDPGLVAPQVKAAQQAGLIVTSSNSWGTTTEMPPPISQGGVSGTWGANGKLYIDVAVATAKGSINAIVVHSSDIGGNDHAQENEFKAELAKICSACDVTYVDQPVAKWSELAQPVAAALVKHPDTNWIIPFYDSMIPFIQSGINQSGVNASSIKMVSGNGSAEILQMIKPGSPVVGDVGGGVTWMGAAVATNIMRQLGGGKPVIYELLPRLFDETNVADVGSPPSYTAGFGDREAWLGEIKAILK